MWWINTSVWYLSRSRGIRKIDLFSRNLMKNLRRRKTHEIISVGNRHAKLEFDCNLAILIFKSDLTFKNLVGLVRDPLGIRIFILSISNIWPEESWIFFPNKDYHLIDSYKVCDELKWYCNDCVFCSWSRAKSCHSA